MSYRDRRLCTTCTDGSSNKEGGMTNKELDALALYVRRERTRRAKISSLQASGRCDTACERASDVMNEPVGTRRKQQLKTGRNTMSKLALRAQTLRAKTSRRRTSVSRRRSTNTGDEDFWAKIAELDWPSDHDAARIRAIMLRWPRAEREAFETTVTMKVFGLADQFKGTVPDGNLDQLLGEVVANGEDFYNDIDRATLLRMHRNWDYTSSFLYATDVEEL